MHFLLSFVLSAWNKARHFNRKQWLRFLLWVVLFQSCLYFLIASRYLPYIEVTQVYSGIYLLGAYIAHFGLIAVLVSLLAVPLAICFPNRLVMFGYCITAVLSVVVLLAIDSSVYTLYRFHLNGFIWDLVTGPGAGDIFLFSFTTVASIVVMAALSALVVFACILLAVHCVENRRLRRRSMIFPTIWFFALLGSQSMHVWYEAHYDAEVTGVTRHFPLYYPATNKRMMERMGWFDPESARAKFLPVSTATNKSVSYPASELHCTPPHNPKNVLVIGVDAMRSDVFTPDIMPNMHALTARQNAQQFSNHYSGGNVTKSGLFSLFYGLPASYWDGFAAAGVGAEWIKQLQAAEYQLGIFTSSTLLSPAFDRTIFSSVPDLRLRSEGKRPSDRDKNSVSDFQDFLANRNKSDPYFGFLFLDSVHGYDVPAGFEKFKPQWDSVDHVMLNNNFDAEPYFNRYKNSLFFVDDLLGKLMEDMQVNGDLDNTIVIFTSDHGEDFNDLKKNYWGHGSNFTDYQTKVPLMILWPGRDSGAFEHRTSHFDIAPTILSDALGCTNPPSDFSVGNNLFDVTKERDWLLIYSYFNYGESL